MEVAKEKGKCDYFDKTKYADGILPIDTYKKDVDEIVKREYSYDWEWLRKEIKEHGLRHSTLSAQMLVSLLLLFLMLLMVLKLPRDYLSIKKSKRTFKTDST